jgi:hypothetical protein
MSPHYSLLLVALVSCGVLAALSVTFWLALRKVRSDRKTQATPVDSPPAERARGWKRLNPRGLRIGCEPRATPQAAPAGSEPPKNPVQDNAVQEREVQDDAGRPASAESLAPVAYESTADQFGQVHAVLSPRGLVEVDGIVYSAWWRGADQGPRPGEMVRVMWDGQTLLAFSVDEFVDTESTLSHQPASRCKFPPRRAQARLRYRTVTDPTTQENGGLK